MTTNSDQLRLIIWITLTNILFRVQKKRLWRAPQPLWLRPRAQRVAIVYIIMHRNNPPTPWGTPDFCIRRCNQLGHHTPCTDNDQVETDVVVCGDPVGCINGPWNLEPLLMGVSVHDSVHYCDLLSPGTQPEGLWNCTKSFLLAKASILQWSQMLMLEHKNTIFW